MQQQISSMPVSSSGRKEGKQTRSRSLPGVTRQIVGEIKLTLCSTVIHVANHQFSTRTFRMVSLFCYEWNFFVICFVKGVSIFLSSLSVCSFWHKCHINRNEKQKRSLVHSCLEAHIDAANPVNPVMA